ncbi:MAG TPA: DUF5615 family PIN-like protein [Thermoanaerobaculia bacterium]|nr:DUF5615 family PIN-like protein [Thermoanaerobaculia bacterium]
MLRFAADENFDNDIVRGFRRRHPEVDIVRVQDAGLYNAEDPVILAWAASEERILLTHDVATMTRFAYDRIAAGLPMSGVIEVKKLAPIGQVIQDLLLLVGCSLKGEWEDRVEYLPLK